MRAAAAWLALALPVAAQEVRVEPMDDGACYARLWVRNVCGGHSARRTVETERGAVVVRWRTKAGCADRDDFEVPPDELMILALPPDTIATPDMLLILEDGREHEIRLCAYRGM